MSSASPRSSASENSSPTTGSKSLFVPCSPDSVAQVEGGADDDDEVDARYLAPDGRPLLDDLVTLGRSSDGSEGRLVDFVRKYEGLSTAAFRASVAREAVKMAEKDLSASPSTAESTPDDAVGY